MPIPFLPVAGAVLLGSAVGAGLQKWLGSSQPKSAFAPKEGQHVRASLKEGAATYEGVLLGVTDSSLTLQLPGGTLRVALDDLDRVEVLA